MEKIIIENQSVLKYWVSREMRGWIGRTEEKDQKVTAEIIKMKHPPYGTNWNDFLDGDDFPTFDELLNRE